jgi:WD40 repeat protein
MLAALLTVLLGPARTEMDHYQTPDCIYEPANPKHGSYHSIAVSPDGKLLAAGTGRGHIIVWDAVSKKQVAKVDQEGIINAVAFSSNGILASADHHGKIRLTDTSTWKLKDTLKYNGGGFYRLAFSPDGAVLLSGGTANNRDLVLWDVAKGIRQQRIHLTDENIPIYGVAFSPDGKQFAASVGTKIKLWDHETCKEVREFDHEGAVTGLAFSPDSSKLVSVSHSIGFTDTPVVGKTSTKLWDVTSGKEIDLPTNVSQGAWTSAAWSPDGKRIALGVGGGVHLLDLKKPKKTALIYVKAKCKGDGHFVCFSPDGKYLYATGKAGLVVTRWKLDAPSEGPPEVPDP